MASSYDYRAWLGDFAKDPTSRWDLTLSVSWAALNGFSDDLNGRLVASARGAGCSVWSEDRDHTRVYHLGGSSAQLAVPVQMLQNDLNQVTENTFPVSGFNSQISSFHAEIVSACREAGLERPEVVRYPGRFRSSLVVTLRGAAGDLIDLMERIGIAVAEVNSQTPQRAPRPATPPIARPLERPDLGLSA